jgi:hypothetical protein
MILDFEDYPLFLKRMSSCWLFLEFLRGQLAIISVGFMKSIIISFHIVLVRRIWWNILGVIEY